jgi:hypothetical protein
MNVTSGWLDAVAFGASAANRSSEHSLRAEAAKQLGIEPELAEELRLSSATERQEVLTFLRKNKRLPAQVFPSEDGPTSVTRAARAEEKARQSPTIERETRQRTTRTSSNRSEARIYLEEKYDRDGQLYCQMSQEPMPFCLPSGAPYFEAVEFLSLGKENQANYLCLSPVCAAEFKHALQTDEETLRARIHSLDARLPEDQLTIQVDVPLIQHRKLRFRRSHLVDLQAALRVLANSAGSPLPSTAAHGPKIIQIREPVTVGDLAALLGLKPFQLIAELMELKYMMSANDTLSRKQMEAIASIRGYALCFSNTSIIR